MRMPCKAMCERIANAERFARSNGKSLYHVVSVLRATSLRSSAAHLVGQSDEFLCLQFQRRKS